MSKAHSSKHDDPQLETQDSGLETRDPGLATRDSGLQMGQGKLFSEERPGTRDAGLVTCLGLTFENDEDRRSYFLEKLREKLNGPEFRKIEGFPIGEDEDILRLSDPPYYTACPNPFLADFVKFYGKPYDPRVPYRKEPFAVDVSEGKTDPIYTAHGYHTKVPHKAIMRAILHYTEPGDIVLDGFAGSGMTAVAVQMCGKPDKEFKEAVEQEWKVAGVAPPKWGPRRVVLNDLGPAATFIAANYNLPFDVRAFERVGNTTRRMSQERYETLLLERAHARRRWKNQPAVDVRLKDLDREEILRTRELAIQQRRISAETSRDIGDILDRLGLRRNGVITQAAQVLYGTKFLPDYPQCLLKMGRFRGTQITGDILDNRQEYMQAFAMIREGMAFLDRTLPLAARFPEGKIFREDRLPVPPDALREILLNAVMHRDYTEPGGHVAIAIFDDRIEIRSTGRLPNGITVDMLSGPHLSKLRNPLIANTFHRTGAVEIWGRGTNRVIEECKQYGIPPPEFEERSETVIVTFWAPIGPSASSKKFCNIESSEPCQKNEKINHLWLISCCRINLKEH